jgi:hypothetical protein
MKGDMQCKHDRFSRGHGSDNIGRLVRITEVTTQASLVEGDNPETPDVREAYYLRVECTKRITAIKPVDGTVINVTEGCNEATSRPVLFEDRAYGRSKRAGQPKPRDPARDDRPERAMKACVFIREKAGPRYKAPPRRGDWPVGPKASRAR